MSVHCTLQALQRLCVIVSVHLPNGIDIPPEQIAPVVVVVLIPDQQAPIVSVQDGRGYCLRVSTGEWVTRGLEYGGRVVPRPRLAALVDAHTVDGDRGVPHCTLTAASPAPAPVPLTITTATDQ